MRKRVVQKLLSSEAPRVEWQVAAAISARVLRARACALVESTARRFYFNGLGG